MEKKNDKRKFCVGMLREKLRFSWISNCVFIYGWHKSVEVKEFIFSICWIMRVFNVS